MESRRSDLKSQQDGASGLFILTVGVITLLILTLLFAALPSRQQPVAEIPANLTSSPTLEPFAGHHICRATIGAVMARDPYIVKVNSFEDGIYFLSYIRPDDGTLWEFKCKHYRNTVVWASYEGRWRDSAAWGDPEITFVVNSSKSEIEILQVYPDRSRYKKIYALADF